MQEQEFKLARITIVRWELHDASRLGRGRLEIGGQYRALTMTWNTIVCMQIETSKSARTPDRCRCHNFNVAC